MEGAAQQTESVESFDDVGEWATEAAEHGAGNDDDWSSPLPEDEEAAEPKKEKVKDDLKVLPDSEKSADGKDIGKKEEVKEEEESDDEESEEEEEEIAAKEEKTEEEKEEEKKPKSKIRMRMGDELYNVDSDATIPVKIDGKTENIPVQELINNYSGKTAWDKKFTELGKEKKSIEFEKNQIQARSQRLEQFVEEALSPLKNPEGNPLDSLLYLVEKSGNDPYAAYRRIMEANLGEINTLLDMTETERELYFHKKKDELYGKVSKQRQAKMEQEQSFNQLAQKVDKLRQAYNVSEDDFVDSADELEQRFKDSGLDPNTITEEDVVDYASLRSHITTVEKLVEPYLENISEQKYGDMVARLSRALREGDMDKQSISQMLKRNFSVEEEVKELNTKVYQKQGSKKPAKKVEVESNELETFDDW